MSGFQARSVVGGVFLQALYDRTEWARWVAAGHGKAAGWAPLPVAPTVVQVVPTSESGGQTWLYTTARPPENWSQPGFDPEGWRSAPGGFGTRGTPGAVVRTEWKTSEIWLRREIILPSGAGKNLALRLHHDEDAEVYINGVLAAKVTGFTSDYDDIPLSPTASKALKTGTNLIAVHCHQTGGGQYIDVGISELRPAK
jgi:hypothetical protein